MKSCESSTASFPSGATGAPDGGVHGGLLLVAGDGVLTTFPLLRDTLVIGRAADCDIALDHPSLSRRHAQLRLGRPIVLEDLGSKNGTRVAGSVLTAGVATPLLVGESFHVGGLTFVVLRGARAVDAST